MILALSGRLRNDYAKKKAEHELKARMASREKQSVYQKKFENDVKQYNSGGNRKGSSEGSTPSGEAGLLKGDKTCMVVDEAQFANSRYHTWLIHFDQYLVEISVFMVSEGYV